VLVVLVLVPGQPTSSPRSSDSACLVVTA
jgi:hypothetical protein